MNRWFLFVAAIAGIALTFVIPVAAHNPPQPEGTVGPGDHVRICHALGQENKDGYVSIAPSAGVVFGHAGSSHQSGQDIIPPFIYVDNQDNVNDSLKDGQNWTAEGQIIWNNGCQTPEVVTTDTVPTETVPTETVPTTPTDTVPECEDQVGSDCGGNPGNEPEPTPTPDNAPPVVCPAGFDFDTVNEECTPDEEEHTVPPVITSNEPQPVQPNGNCPQGYLYDNVPGPNDCFPRGVRGKG